MDREPFYVLLSTEAMELLADNEIDLVQELRRQGIDVQRGYGENPASQGEGQERDVVLVLLASAALATALGVSIPKILDAVGRNRRFLAEEVELAPVTGPNNEPVYGRDGKPVLYWRQTHRLIEPGQSAREEKFEIQGLGIRVSQESSSKPDKGE